MQTEVLEEGSRNDPNLVAVTDCGEMQMVAYAYD